MASVASNCIYKSVTLAVGEVFTLPPGAEIVSTSGGLQSFTSTCPKPTTLDTTKRYRIQWEINECSNNTTHAWENGFFTGVSIGGGPRATVTINGYNGQNLLISFLKDTINTPFTNYTSGQRGPVGCAMYFFIEFDSPSLIAESTIFYMKVEGRDPGTVTGTYMEIIPFAV